MGIAQTIAAIPNMNKIPVFEGSKCMGYSHSMQYLAFESCANKMSEL